MVVITGANSGFGLEMAIEFATSSFFVVATMRDITKRMVLMDIARERGIEENIKILPLDVTIDCSVKEFQTYIEELNRVDVLINNAGYAGAGFAEEVSILEYQEQMNTNLYGTIRVTQSILPIMRKQEQGRIINISSISGLLGFPGISPYVSSKFALEGWSEALRLELLPFSIYVALVEPGSFRTNIWTSGKKMATESQKKTSPYWNYLKQIESYLENSSKHYEGPSIVAKKVYKIANENSPRLRYSVGRGVKQMMLARQWLPWKFWEKLVLFMINKS